MRVAKIRIRHSGRLTGPIRNHEPPEARPVVPSSKVIEVRFRVPFFAGELIGMRDGAIVSIGLGLHLFETASFFSHSGISGANGTFVYLMRVNFPEPSMS